jgi:endonuclease/exonuclease/phosphatase family metal-dependent hydrolase
MPALLTVLVLCLTGPALAQAPDPVRAVTYNVRYDAAADDPGWTVRRPHLVAQLVFLDADLIGVQEALPHQVVHMAEGLPGHDHYGVGRDDGADAGETTTLFWRRDRFEALSRETFWCSPTPDRPSKGWDAALPRTITRVVLRDRLDGEVWDVRNTHFDHVGQEARLRCAEQIASLEPAPGARLIVMGDFNTGPETDPYRALIASGLSDARVVSPAAFGPTGTYNAFDATRGQGAPAIDHIFVGPGLSVLRVGVLTDTIGGKAISDHFPVAADVWATAAGEHGP